MSDNNKEIRYILLAILGSIALGVFALLSIFPNLLSGGGFWKESALDMALLSFLGIAFVFLARHRRLSLWIFNTSFTVFIFLVLFSLLSTVQDIALTTAGVAFVAYHWENPAGDKIDAYLKDRINWLLKKLVS